MVCKRTVLTFYFLFVSCGLCAFDLQYGSFFTVRNIVLKQGQPVLPLARGKYANVRVLDKDTFLFLKTCVGDCRQESVSAAPALFEIREALTRPGMWIADIYFDGKWLITFLIFQNKSGFDVKEPDDFVFLDKQLKKEVEKMLSSAAARMERKERSAEESK